MIIDQRALDLRTRTTTSRRFNSKFFRVLSKNIQPGELHCTTVIFIEDVLAPFRFEDD